jgi:ribosome-associated heat shock protein Hsp15
VSPPHAGQVRLDKWLWAARFFKTRALAAEAVARGHVAVNGRCAKPSKAVSPGDTVAITKERIEWTVVVRLASPRRGPASEAAMLYEETPESSEARNLVARARARERAAASGGLVAEHGGRPSKRDRRRMERVRESRDRFRY